jgi:hypothetical protein
MQQMDMTAYPFQTAPLQSDELILTGLVANSKYAVAVAPVDHYGNVGELSAAECATFSSSSSSGSSSSGGSMSGGGHGGSCSIASVGSPVKMGYFAIVGGLGVVVLRRRRREKSAT